MANFIGTRWQQYTTGLARGNGRGPASVLEAAEASGYSFGAGRLLFRW